MHTDKDVGAGQFLDIPSGRGDAARYALAAATVMLATLGAAQIAVLPEHDIDTISDTESAVMIDLPAASAPAPGQVGNDAADRLAAVPAAPQPPIIQPPEVEPPLDPPPPADDRAGVLERAAPPPPKLDATPPPQDAQAAAGSDQPAQKPAVADEADHPQATAHALTLWQKAMATRLQAAKRSTPRRVGGSGTVQVVFTIDRDGRVVSEKVDRTSGDAALDAAASALVRRAAPFPSPPPEAREADLVFTVPIRFRQ